MARRTVKLDAELIERVMNEGFVGLCVPLADAAGWADVLVTADKRGIDSHGVNR